MAPRLAFWLSSYSSYPFNKQATSKHAHGVKLETALTADEAALSTEPKRSKRTNSKTNTMADDWTAHHSAVAKEARAKSEARRQRILEHSTERMGVVAQPKNENNENLAGAVTSPSDAASRMQAMRRRRFKSNTPDSKTKGDEKEPAKVTSARKSGKKDTTAAPTLKSAPVDTASSEKDAKPPAVARAPPLCRFFILQGDCRYGEDCHFSHTLPEGGITEARKQIPCRFYLQGNCRYGDRCELRHGTQEELENEALHQNICGICLEPVGSEYNKRFGLLEECSHVYCMDCIMSWRKEGSREAQDRRVCPSCRKKSLFIIPSWEYCVGEEKKRVMNMYKAKLSKLPCKRFDGTLGSCPFGRDCFHAHMRNGKDVKSQEKSKDELDRDREVRRRRAQELDDLDVIHSFLMLLELTRDLDEWDSDSEDDSDLEWFER